MSCADAVACSLCGGEEETRIRRDFETADCGVEVREDGGGAVHGGAACDVYFRFGGAGGGGS